jgi:hypothetical protein
VEKARFAAAPAFLSIVSGISRAVSTSPAEPTHSVSQIPDRLLARADEVIE